MHMQKGGYQRSRLFRFFGAAKRDLKPPNLALYTPDIAS